ncbi:MAG TPA: cyanophycinase [Gemmatimonadales bacterium]|nr:cyanophycinase [Gemmatimonadales bacterium]
MSPARADDGSPRGYIVPVGGAESKIGDPAILRRFVRLAGGRDARIAIIATASQLPDTGERYEAIFRELGVRAARALAIDTRQDAERDEWVEKLERADGIFLTGGNQLRLSTTLGGTSVARAIRRRNAMGVHVAGTSAGAAFLSEHMIATGDEGATPHARSVTLSPGLGLTNRVVIDQHFRQRDRLGRLLTALAYNPFAIGLGLDEDTAAFIGPDNTFEVAGTGAITVVDPSELEFSSMDQVEQDDPVCLIGVRLHVLVRGATFDLQARKAYAPQATN